MKYSYLFVILLTIGCSSESGSLDKCELPEGTYLVSSTRISGNCENGYSKEMTFSKNSSIYTDSCTTKASYISKDFCEVGLTARCKDINGGYCESVVQSEIAKDGKEMWQYITSSCFNRDESFRCSSSYRIYATKISMKK